MCMPSFCAYILLLAFELFKSRNTKLRLYTCTHTCTHVRTLSEWVKKKAKWRRRIQSIQRRLQITGKFKNAAISQWNTLTRIECGNVSFSSLLHRRCVSVFFWKHFHKNQAFWNQLGHSIYYFWSLNPKIYYGNLYVRF